MSRGRREELTEKIEQLTFENLDLNGEVESRKVRLDRATRELEFSNPATLSRGVREELTEKIEQLTFEILDLNGEVESRKVRLDRATRELESLPPPVPPSPAQPRSTWEEGDQVVITDDNAWEGRRGTLVSKYGEGMWNIKLDKIQTDQGYQFIWKPDYCFQRI